MAPLSPQLESTLNVTYLRHVIYKFLADEPRREQLLPVITQMLHFSADEMNAVSKAKGLHAPKTAAGIFGWS